MFGTEGMERRRSSRLKLELPCRLSHEGRAWASEGTTVDVTRQGALIECLRMGRSGQIPQVGDTLIIEIALPQGPADRRCFRGRAKIVRLERGAGSLLRLAVEFSKLQFALWRTKPQAAAAGPGAGGLEAAAWGQP